MKILLWASYRT